MRVYLGEGQMASPQVSDAAMIALRKMIDATLGELEFQEQSIASEEAALEPAALAANPGGASGISDMGSLDPREVRSIVVTAAIALKGAANRVLSGSASTYLDAAEQSRARAVSDSAQRILSYLQSLETLPITHDSQAADYLDGHMYGVDQDVAKLEQAIVTAEAGSVPVIEPYERTAAVMNVALAVGGIGLAVYLIVHFSKGGAL